MNIYKRYIFFSCLSRKVNSICKNLSCLTTGDHRIWPESSVYVTINPLIFHCKGDILSIPSIIRHIRKSSIGTDKSIVTSKCTNKNFYKFCTSGSSVRFKFTVIDGNTIISITKHRETEIFFIPFESSIHKYCLYIICKLIFWDIGSSKFMFIEHPHNCRTDKVCNRIFYRDRWII